MEKLSELVVALVIGIVAVIIGFICRQLPSKWALPVAALFGALSGGSITYFFGQGHLPFGIAEGRTTLPTYNTFPTIFDTFFRLVPVLLCSLYSLLSGIWASLVASDSFRKRVWQFQSGDRSSKGLKTASNKAEQPKESPKETKISLLLYLGFGILSVLFGCVFLAVVQSTLSYEKVEGQVVDIDLKNDRWTAKGSTHAVRIEYPVDGVNHRLEKYYPQDKLPKLNSKIHLIYDPKEPSKVEIDQRIIMIITALFTWLVGGSIIYWVIRHARGSASDR